MDGVQLPLRVTKSNSEKVVPLIGLCVGQKLFGAQNASQAEFFVSRGLCDDEGGVHCSHEGADQGESHIGGRSGDVAEGVDAEGDDQGLRTYLRTS